MFRESDHPVMLLGVRTKRCLRSYPTARRTVLYSLTRFELNRGQTQIFTALPEMLVKSLNEPDSFPREITVDPEVIVYLLCYVHACKSPFWVRANIAHDLASGMRKYLARNWSNYPPSESAITLGLREVVGIIDDVFQYYGYINW